MRNRLRSIPTIAPRRRQSGVQSIRRALNVMRVLASRRDAGLPLGETANFTGLTRPTAHRILTTLVAEGMVEKMSRTGRYVLGDQIQLLALARSGRSPLLTAAEPHLDSLAKKIGDALFLTLRTGLDTVCIARRLGHYPIQVLVIEVGDRRPLGITSAGLAMLAKQRKEESREIIVQNASRFSFYGVTVHEALKGVADARALGYCFRKQGIVPGTRALSVAFNDVRSKACAALTAVAVSHRMPTQRVSEIVDLMTQSAQAILATLHADTLAKL